jgi:hypothetical protein
VDAGTLAFFLAPLDALKITDLISARSCASMSGSSMKTEALRPVAGPFIGSRERVDQLAQMPLAIAGLSAERARGGNYVSPGHPPSGTIERFLVDKEGNSRNISIKGPWWLLKGLDDPEELKRRVHEAKDIIDFFLIAGGAGSLQAWLSSLLLGAWTAFETFAGDFWEAPRSVHPQTLASLFSKSATRDAKGRGKSLPMRHLEEDHYDLQNKMGTVLRDHRRNFQRLDGVAEAYQRAFPKGCLVSRDMFWKNHEVRSLCAIRNVIVHRAGILDEAFQRQRCHDPRLAHYKVGDQLSLDGELVQQMIGGLVAFIETLITEVAGWILANPACNGAEQCARPMRGSW